MQVTFTLTRNNVLRMAYRAISDKDTVISLTNHAYFNMAGDASGPVLDQLLTVNADQITAVDDKNVPTGEMKNVAGTGFDYRKPTPIGAHINDPDPAIQRAKGLDQNYAINGKPGTLRLAARLEDPKSGRVLEEWTTQAGLQVYSANYRSAAGRAWPRAIRCTAPWRWRRRLFPMRPIFRASPARCCRWTRSTTR